MLGIIAMTKRETSENVAAHVHEILEEWEIQDQIMGVTTDGARNFRKAICNVLDMPWLYCLAHAINHSVYLGLSKSSVKTLFKKPKAICRYFRASPKAARLLLEQQKALKVSTKKLTLDNKTRWNSAYKMLKRLVRSRPTVSSTLASITETRKPPPPDLTSDEWRKLTDLIPVLKPIKDITKFISQEKHVTIGFVLPLMHRLIHSKMARSTADSTIEIP
jgi:hypothetical protein